MPRTYSKTGCVRCKLRKKKCSEDRPRCAACAKWNWTCEYDHYSSTRELTAMSSRNLPAYGSLPLQVLGLRGPGYSEMECRVLQNVPDQIKQYYSPTSDHQLTDLQTMFQLMKNNDVLRHAIVACFTAIGDTEGLAKLHRVSYGRALQSLRSKVLYERLDQEERICVIVAIAFLGKMESFGPNSFADQLEHWVALIPLLESKEMLEIIDRRVIPLNETMLILESLLYHIATDALFSHNVDRVWHLWRTHRTYELICTLNPEGSNRVNLSPLLAGQYELYDIALHVTYLFRGHQDDYVSSQLADDLEDKVRRRHAKLDVEFTANANSAIDRANYKVARIVYRAFCNSLLIVITALREPSRAQKIQMQHLHSCGAKLYLWRPSALDVPITMQHAAHLTLAAIWPIQILFCSCYDLEQLKFLLKHFSDVENHLDHGHQKRTRVLFGRLSNILRPPKDNGLDSDTDAPLLPPGLTLLRQGFDSLDPG